MISNYNSTGEDNIDTFYQLVNGRIVFQDVNSLRNLLYEFNRSDSEIDRFYSAHPEFKSAYTKYEEDLEKFKSGIISEDAIDTTKSLTLRITNGEKEIVPTIDFTLLRHVVNSENLVQIGEDVWYITYKNLYVLKAEKLIESNQQTVFNIDEAYKAYEITRSIDDNSRSVWDEATHTYSSCLVERRCLGNMETTNAVLYAEVRLTSKHSKKSLGIWFAEKADKIVTNGSGYFSFDPDGDSGPNPRTTDDYNIVNYTKYDANDANKVIHYFVDLGFFPDYEFEPGCSNSHFFEKDCTSSTWTGYTSY